MCQTFAFIIEKEKVRVLRRFCLIWIIAYYCICLSSHGIFFNDILMQEGFTNGIATLFFFNFMVNFDEKNRKSTAIS